jgi:hypothetical protein
VQPPRLETRSETLSTPPPYGGSYTEGYGLRHIRTSHNMPAPELVSLDELGLMLMVEAV